MLSAVRQAEGRLQVVGVGSQSPPTRPSWNAESRLPPEQEDS